MCLWWLVICTCCKINLSCVHVVCCKELRWRANKEWSQPFKGVKKRKYNLRLRRAIETIVEDIRNKCYETKKNHYFEVASGADPKAALFVSRKSARKDQCQVTNIMHGTCTNWFGFTLWPSIYVSIMRHRGLIATIVLSPNISQDSRTNLQLLWQVISRQFGKSYLHHIECWKKSSSTPSRNEHH